MPRLFYGQGLLSTSGGACANTSGPIPDPLEVRVSGVVDTGGPPDDAAPLNTIHNMETNPGNPCAVRLLNIPMPSGFWSLELEARSDGHWEFTFTDQGFGEILKYQSNPLNPPPTTGGKIIVQNYNDFVYLSGGGAPPYPDFSNVVIEILPISSGPIVAVDDVVPAANANEAVNVNVLANDTGWVTPTVTIFNPDEGGGRAIVEPDNTITVKTPFTAEGTRISFLYKVEEGGNSDQARLHVDTQAIARIKPRLSIGNVDLPQYIVELQNGPVSGPGLPTWCGFQAFSGPFSSSQRQAWFDAVALAIQNDSNCPGAHLTWSIGTEDDGGPHPNDRMWSWNEGQGIGFATNRQAGIDAQSLYDYLATHPFERSLIHTHTLEFEGPLATNDQSDPVIQQWAWDSSLWLRGQLEALEPGYSSRFYTYRVKHTTIGKFPEWSRPIYPSSFADTDAPEKSIQSEDHFGWRQIADNIVLPTVNQVGAWVHGFRRHPICPRTPGIWPPSNPTAQNTDEYVCSGPGHLQDELFNGEAVGCDWLTIFTSRHTPLSGPPPIPNWNIEDSTVWAEHVHAMQRWWDNELVASDDPVLAPSARIPVRAL